MRDAPILLDRLAPEDAEHFERVKALLDDAGIALRARPHAGARPGLLRPDRVGVHLRRARRPVGRRRRRALRRADRAARRRRRRPGVGWAAGVERMLLAAGEQPVAARPRRPVRRHRPHATTPRAQAPSSSPTTPAGPACSAQLELAGRGLKGQLKHADRLGARYVAIIGDPMQISLKDMEAGDQTELEPATRSSPRSCAGAASREARAPRQHLPRHLGRAARRRRGRAATRSRLGVGAPPP